MATLQGAYVLEKAFHTIYESLGVGQCLAGYGFVYYGILRIVGFLAISPRFLINASKLDLDMAGFDQVFRKRRLNP